MESICKPERSKGTTEDSCVKEIGKEKKIYTWYYPHYKYQINMFSSFFQIFHTISFN